MFAVFNHLKSYSDFEKGILNLYEHLNDNGIIIIDLHNGRKSGEKETEIGNAKRIMKWHFNSETFIETTNLTYLINDKQYDDVHIFLIYELEKLKNMLNLLNLQYDFYENYSFEAANDLSKNIQIVIRK